MRVLLIEDELDLAEALRSALAEEGFAVDHTADGGEGLDRALEGGHDVIVLDLMLPGLDGTAVLRNLRREIDTPVLVLTARDSLEDRVGRLQDGADDYLTKPFELPELVARLHALIRRSARSGLDRIDIGDLSIDLRQREVRVAGVAVELTIQEYRLLETLALRRGEPVSSDELWHRLSGVGDSSGAVRVHVHNLRRKLGAERIRTRLGLGYSLVDPGG